MTAPDPDSAALPGNPEAGPGVTVVFGVARGGKAHVLRGERTACGLRGPFRVAPGRAFADGDWCRRCRRSV